MKIFLWRITLARVNFDANQIEWCVWEEWQVHIEWISIWNLCGWRWPFVILTSRFDFVFRSETSAPNHMFWQLRFLFLLWEIVRKLYQSYDEWMLNGSIRRIFLFIHSPIEWNQLSQCYSWNQTEIRKIKWHMLIPVYHETFTARIERWRWQLREWQNSFTHTQRETLLCCHFDNFNPLQKPTQSLLYTTSHSVQLNQFYNNEIHLPLRNKRMQMICELVVFHFMVKLVQFSVHTSVFERLNREIFREEAPSATQ